MKKTTEPENIVLEDQAKPRENYTMLPNVLDDIGMSSIAIRVYFHLKRRAGENSGGLVYETVSHMAEWCDMTKPTFIKARKQLEKMNLIKTYRIPSTNNEYEKINIIVVDIWDHNRAYFSQSKELRSERRMAAKKQKGAYFEIDE